MFAKKKLHVRTRMRILRGDANFYSATMAGINTTIILVVSRYTPCLIVNALKKNLKKRINYLIAVDESSPLPHPPPNLHTRRRIAGRESKERRRRVYITLEYRFFLVVNPPWVWP